MASLCVVARGQRGLEETSNKTRLQNIKMVTTTPPPQNCVHRTTPLVLSMSQNNLLLSGTGMYNCETRRPDPSFLTPACAANVRGGNIIPVWITRVQVRGDTSSSFL